MWKGVSVDPLLAEVDTNAKFVSAWCDGGYTTNLPTEDMTGGRAWIADSSVVSRFTLSTGALRDCWFRTGTSGRVPSGCADWSSVTMPSPASGKATATTTTETRGGRSATKVTDGSAGNRRAAAD